MAFTASRLTGQHVDLVPLEPLHHDGLIKAVQDGELSALWYTHIPTPSGMAAEIDRRLHLRDIGSMYPYTVIERQTGRIAGMTTYMNIDASAPRVEIGSTWYAASAQRTALNTEAKLLLLSHAFDAMNCLAVEFRTHLLNHQSRRAIERLGAKLDGVLRQHMPMPNGSIRDTCVYSIVAAEWPAVRAGLQWKLEHQYRDPR